MDVGSPLHEAAREEQELFSSIHSKSTLFFLWKGFVTWEAIPVFAASSLFIPVGW